MLLLLLAACALLDAVGVASKVDRSVCELVVRVDAESCPCVLGISWTAVDEAGATFVSVDATGAPGPQPVGTSQSHEIAAGTFQFDATWLYDDGYEAYAEGPFACEGGGYTRQNLSCECEADTGGDTGGETGG